MAAREDYAGFVLVYGRLYCVGRRLMDGLHGPGNDPGVNIGQVDRRIVFKLPAPYEFFAPRGAKAAKHGFSKGVCLSFPDNVSPLRG
jgi:hypothetical protein